MKLPPDKIVLSAKLFSRIVNNLSYAESAGVAEQGIVHELVDDVKNNQDMIEKRKTVSKPVETKKRYYSTDGLDELLSLIRKDLTI